MKLYQSYIGDHQKSFLSKATIPFDASWNMGGDQREYELFRKISAELEAGGTEPWGMVSWKFQHKSLIAPEVFMAYADEKLSDGYDCVFINPMIGNEAVYVNVWEQGEHCGHRGSLQIAAYLAQKLGPGFTRAMGRSCFCFCNYFIAKPAFWTAYFKFIQAALEHLAEEAERDTEVGRAYRGPAHYSKDETASMRPFVIERLFSSFICNTTLRCTGYQYSANQYNSKFGTQLGAFLRKMSEMKNMAIEMQDQQLLDQHHVVRCNVLEAKYKTPISQLDDPSDYFLSAEYRSTFL